MMPCRIIEIYVSSNVLPLFKIYESPQFWRWKWWTRQAVTTSRRGRFSDAQSWNFPEWLRKSQKCRTSVTRPRPEP
jgi:hypothetical protein